MRSLSADEKALWARVASTIRPLSREKVDRPGRVPPVEPGAETNSDQKVPSPRSFPQRPRAPAPRPVRAPGSTLDGSWDRRLSSGSVQPERIVDLHGKTLDGAWRAIDHALDEAIHSGERVLLLITGHQRAGEPPIRRGAIRAAVHDWLGASRHAGDIAAVRAAHGRHGGGGSLYIILRRRTRR